MTYKINEINSLFQIALYTATVKPVLSGHPRDPRYCPLNRGVHLIQDWREKKIRLTEAGVRLIQGVRLIWGPLNTDFTVFWFPPYNNSGQKIIQFYRKWKNHLLNTVTWYSLFWNSLLLSRSFQTRWIVQFFNSWFKTVRSCSWYMFCSLT